MMNLKTCAESLLLDSGQGLHDEEAGVVLLDVAAWLEESSVKEYFWTPYQNFGHGESETTCRLKKIYGTNTKGGFTSAMVSWIYL
jgi:hypothetical protein